MWCDWAGSACAYVSAMPVACAEYTPCRTVVNLCREGHLDKAMLVLLRMDQQGCVPSAGMFKTLLQACMQQKALAQARRVQAHLARHGLETDPCLGQLVVSTLVNCGGLNYGLQLFRRLPHRTVFSWTAVISGYCKAGDGRRALSCYEQMQQEGVHPNNYTLVALLKACTSLRDLNEGKRMHAHARHHGLESDVFVATALVSMYAKCRSLEDAHHVFNQLSDRNVVSWNAILAAYTQNGQGEQALNIFWKMQEEGGIPDARTCVAALQACGIMAEQEENATVGGLDIVKLDSLHAGKTIHAQAAGRGLACNIFVRNALVTMYARCGSIEDAQRLFDQTADRTVVSWNALVAAYSQQGQGQKALRIYAEMQEKGVEADDRTFVSALQACGSLAEREESTEVDGQHIRVESLRKGKELHERASRVGYDVFVGNTLVSMYAKCGNIKDSEYVFDRMCLRDVMSWKTMIAAYAEQDQGEKALHTYGLMQTASVQPNEPIFQSVLEACSNMGLLEICRQTHRKIIECGLEGRLSVANSLIHAFGKCGSMVDAQFVFHSLASPDVVSWTALIAGYGRQGNCEASQKCYEDMLLAGVRPNEVTFLALLAACGHAGMVDRGLELFVSMTRDHGLIAGPEHYVSLINLLCRGGLFTIAEGLAGKLPMQLALHGWLCLLSASQRHGKVSVGRRAFDCAVALEPKQAAAYVVMSNIYAQAGMWECAREIDGMRQTARACKKPGQSWIEHEKEVHTFLVGDQRHQQGKLLYGLLNELRLILGQRPKLGG